MKCLRCGSEKILQATSPVNKETGEKIRGFRGLFGLYKKDSVREEHVAICRECGYEMNFGEYVPTR